MTIEEIAKTILGLRTLETRNRDHLDFVELPVWKIKAALVAAKAAGWTEAEKSASRVLTKTEEKIRKVGAKAYYEK